MSGELSRFAKNSTTIAEKVDFNAINGDINFSSAKSVVFSAKKDLVYGCYKQPEGDETVDLVVKKVEGPKSVEIGKTYTFKATEFSRKAIGGELSKVKWAYQLDDEDIIDFPKPGKVVGNIVTKEVTIADEVWDNKVVKIYAYLKNKEAEGKIETIVKVLEKIFIVGTEQHSATYGNKMMFPAQAIREIKENIGTKLLLTILMFSDGYNSDELSVVRRDGKKLFSNLNFIKIDSTKELIGYVNKGNNKVSRGNIKIKEIKIFSHGLPSIFDFGLDGPDQNSQRFKVSHVSQLKKDVFDSNAEIYSYACRTGNSDSRVIASVPGYSYGDDWLTQVKPKESLAQKLANHLEISVYAFLRRSLYISTWDDKGDEKYIEKYKQIDDETINGQIYRPHQWDEALWNPNGAYSKPTAAATPKGLPAKLYIFKKGEEPKVK